MRTKTKAATLNISVPPELGKYIQGRVTSGMYSSASEVVREALRLLIAQEKLQEIRLVELREKVAEGLADARAGRVVDGPKAMQRMQRSISKRNTRARE